MAITDKSSARKITGGGGSQQLSRRALRPWIGGKVPDRNDYDEGQMGLRRFEEDFRRFKIFANKPPKGAPSQRSREPKESFYQRLNEWNERRLHVIAALKIYREDLTLQQKQLVESYSELPYPAQQEWNSLAPQWKVPFSCFPNPCPHNDMAKKKRKTSVCELTFEEFCRVSWNMMIDDKVLTLLGKLLHGSLHEATRSKVLYVGLERAWLASSSRFWDVGFNEKEYNSTFSGRKMAEYERILFHFHKDSHYAFAIVSPSLGKIWTGDSMGVNGEGHDWAYRRASMVMSKAQEFDGTTPTVNFQHIKMKVPTQDDSINCGLFSLLNGWIIAVMDLMSGTSVVEVQDVPLFTRDDMPRVRQQLSHVIVGGIHGIICTVKTRDDMANHIRDCFMTHPPGRNGGGRKNPYADRKVVNPYAKSATKKMAFPLKKAAPGKQPQKPSMQQQKQHKDQQREGNLTRLHPWHNEKTGKLVFSDDLNREAMSNCDENLWSMRPPSIGDIKECMSFDLDNPRKNDAMATKLAGDIREFVQLFNDYVSQWEAVKDCLINVFPKILPNAGEEFWRVFRSYYCETFTNLRRCNEQLENGQNFVAQDLINEDDRFYIDLIKERTERAELVRRYGGIMYDGLGKTYLRSFCNSLYDKLGNVSREWNSFNSYQRMIMTFSQVYQEAHTVVKDSTTKLQTMIPLYPDEDSDEFKNFPATLAHMKFLEYKNNSLGFLVALCERNSVPVPDDLTTAMQNLQKQVEASSSTCCKPKPKRKKRLVRLNGQPISSTAPAAPPPRKEQVQIDTAARKRIMISDNEDEDDDNNEEKAQSNEEDSQSKHNETQTTSDSPAAALDIADGYTMISNALESHCSKEKNTTGTEVNLLFHQKQTALHCAVCTANAILQAPVFTCDAFRAFACKCAAEEKTMLKQHFGLDTNPVKDDHGSPLGNFTYPTLCLALEKVGLTLECANNGDENRKCPFIVVTGTHYYGIIYMWETYWNLDSKFDWPKPMENVEVASLLKKYVKDRVDSDAGELPYSCEWHMVRVVKKNTNTNQCNVKIGDVPNRISCQERLPKLQYAPMFFGEWSGECGIYRLWPVNTLHSLKRSKVLKKICLTLKNDAVNKSYQRTKEYCLEYNCLQLVSDFSTHFGLDLSLVCGELVVNGVGGVSFPPYTWANVPLLSLFSGKFLADETTPFMRLHWKGSELHQGGCPTEEGKSDNIMEKVATHKEGKSDDGEGASTSRKGEEEEEEEDGEGSHLSHEERKSDDGASDFGKEEEEGEDANTSGKGEEEEEEEDGEGSHLSHEEGKSEDEEGAALLRTSNFGNGEEEDDDEDGSCLSPRQLSFSSGGTNDSDQQFVNEYASNSTRKGRKKKSAASKKKSGGNKGNKDDDGYDEEEKSEEDNANNDNDNNGQSGGGEGGEASETDPHATCIIQDCVVELRNIPPPTPIAECRVCKNDFHQTHCGTYDQCKSCWIAALRAENVAMSKRGTKRGPLDTNNLARMQYPKVNWKGSKPETTFLELGTLKISQQHGSVGGKHPLHFASTDVNDMDVDDDVGSTNKRRTYCGYEDEGGNSGGNTVIVRTDQCLQGLDVVKDGGVDIIAHIMSSSVKLLSMGAAAGGKGILSNAALLDANKFLVKDVDNIGLVDYVQALNGKSKVLYRKSLPTTDDRGILDVTHEFVKALQKQLSEHDFKNLEESVKEDPSLMFLGFISIWHQGEVVDHLHFDSFVLFHTNPRQAAVEIEVRVAYVSELFSGVSVSRLLQIAAAMAWKRKDYEVVHVKTFNPTTKRFNKARRVVTKGGHVVLPCSCSRYYYPESLLEIFNRDYRELPVQQRNEKYKNINPAATNTKNMIVECLRYFALAPNESYLPVGEVSHTDIFSTYLPSVAGIPFSLVVHYLASKREQYFTDVFSQLMQWTSLRPHYVVEEAGIQFSWGMHCQCCNQLMHEATFPLDKIINYGPLIILSHLNLSKVRAHATNKNWSNLFERDDPRFKDKNILQQFRVRRCKVDVEARKRWSDAVKVDSHNEHNLIGRQCNSIVCSSLLFPQEYEVSKDSMEEMEDVVANTLVYTSFARQMLAMCLLLGKDSTELGNSTIHLFKYWSGKQGTNYDNLKNGLCELSEKLDEGTKVVVDSLLSTLSSQFIVLGLNTEGNSLLTAPLIELIDDDTEIFTNPHLLKERPHSVKLATNYKLNPSDSISVDPSWSSHNQVGSVLLSAPQIKHRNAQDEGEKRIAEFNGKRYEEQLLVEEERLSSENSLLFICTWYYGRWLVRIDHTTTADMLDQEVGDKFVVPLSLKKVLNQMELESTMLVVICNIDQRSKFVDQATRFGENLAWFIPTDHYLQCLPREVVESVTAPTGTADTTNRYKEIPRVTRQSFRNKIDTCLQERINSISLRSVFPHIVFEVRRVQGSNICVDGADILDTGMFVDEWWKEDLLLSSGVITSGSRMQLHVGPGKKRPPPTNSSIIKAGENDMNKWHCRRNKDNLCVAGSIANWLHFAGLPEIAHQLMEWAEGQMDNSCVDKLQSVFNQLRSYCICHQVITFQRELSLKDISAVFTDFQAPCLVLLSFGMSLQDHALVIYKNRVFDFQDECSYVLSLSNLNSKLNGEQELISSCKAYYFWQHGFFHVPFPSIDEFPSSPLTCLAPSQMKDCLIRCFGDPHKKRFRKKRRKK